MTEVNIFELFKGTPELEDCLDELEGLKPLEQYKTKEQTDEA